MYEELCGINIRLAYVVGGQPTGKLGIGMFSLEKITFTFFYL